MQSRLVAALTLVFMLAAVACGGSRSGPTPTPDSAGDTPVVESASPTTAPPATATAAKKTTRNSGSSVLPLIFNNAFSAGSGGAGIDGTQLGSGDVSLKQYLLTAAELPAGYRPAGEFTARLPDGISTQGGGDVAVGMAAKGDALNADRKSFSMLMSMAMRFDDLQALADVLGQCPDERQLKDELAGSGGGGLFGDLLKDVQVLDASGLGDGGCGLAMTMDLGGLADLFGAGSGSGEVPSSITMRMYFFGRGRYAGALIRMAAGESLRDGVDERALAKIIDDKLKAAP